MSFLPRNLFVIDLLYSGTRKLVLTLDIIKMGVGRVMGKKGKKENLHAGKKNKNKTMQFIELNDLMIFHEDFGQLQE